MKMKMKNREQGSQKHSWRVTNCFLFKAIHLWLLKIMSMIIQHSLYSLKVRMCLLILVGWACWCFLSSSITSSKLIFFYMPSVNPYIWLKCLTLKWNEYLDFICEQLTLFKFVWKWNTFFYIPLPWTSQCSQCSQCFLSSHCSGSQSIFLQPVVKALLYFFVRIQIKLNMVFLVKFSFKMWCMQNYKI